MVEEQITQDEICQPRRPGHTLFPEFRNISAGIDLCRKMKGIISEVKSEKQQRDMNKIYKDIMKDEYATAGIF